MRLNAIQWASVPGSSVQREDAYVGRWVVASIFYDSSRSQSESKKWAVSCSLPGIRSHLGYYYSAAEAKVRAAAAVKYWFQHLDDEPGLKTADR